MKNIDKPDKVPDGAMAFEETDLMSMMTVPMMMFRMLEDLSGSEIIPDEFLEPLSVVAYSSLQATALLLQTLPQEAYDKVMGASASAAERLADTFAGAMVTKVMSKLSDTLLTPEKTRPSIDPDWLTSVVKGTHPLIAPLVGGGKIDLNSPDEFAVGVTHARSKKNNISGFASMTTQEEAVRLASGSCDGY